MQIGKQPEIIRRNVDNKKKIVDLLKEIGLINGEFIGKITINISQGGFQSIEKIEHIKL